MKPELPEVNRSPSKKLYKCFPDSGGENAKALRPKKACYTCIEYDWNLKYDGEIVKKNMALEVERRTLRDTWAYVNLISGLLLLLLLLLVLLLLLLLCRILRVRLCVTP